MINIKWFGHSMWKIWNEEISIITDPFTDIGYQLPKNETADLILSSHDHFDHNNFSLIKGNPKIIKSAGTYNVKGCSIKTISVFHDETRGSERGKNLLMKFTISGKTFLHCGDLGHNLSDETIENLGKIDLIFIPVGGYYTIDAQTAKSIVEKIKPVVIFPMHYKTEKIDFPIAPLDEYLKIITNIKRIDSNQISLDSSDLNNPHTYILNYD